MSQVNPRDWKRAPRKAEVVNCACDFYCTEATIHLMPISVISPDGVEMGLLEINGILQKSDQRLVIIIGMETKGHFTLGFFM